MIKKYNEQQKNVRNNREFDSLTKETEYQELEIQLAEKNIKEFRVNDTSDIEIGQKFEATHFEEGTFQAEVRPQCGQH